MNLHERVEYHECPGGCGRDDIPGNRFACEDCIDRLPRSLAEGLRKPSPSEILAVRSRAKIWFENTRTAGA